MAAKNRITVNMTDAEYAALSELAARFQVSLAWLGRRAMAELVERYRKESDQLKMPFLKESDEEKKV
jgi:hypothetical protein